MKTIVKLTIHFIQFIPLVSYLYINEKLFQKIFMLYIMLMSIFLFIISVYRILNLKIFNEIILQPIIYSVIGYLIFFYFVENYLFLLSSLSWLGFILILYKYKNKEIYKKNHFIFYIFSLLYSFVAFCFLNFVNNIALYWLIILSLIIFINLIFELNTRQLSIFYSLNLLVYLFMFFKNHSLNIKLIESSLFYETKEIIIISIFIVVYFVNLFRNYILTKLKEYRF